jgi:hypothetical protein
VASQSGSSRGPDHKETSQVVEVIIERGVRSGDGIDYAGRQSLRTREQRALRLYHMRGADITQMGADFYLCPSWDGTKEYLVNYPVDEGETESCECADHTFRGSTCMHILAVAIRHAKKRAQSRRNFIHAWALGEDE